jgi:hypothetical protein
MLKQSLVQEKISDLSLNAGSGSSSAVNNATINMIAKSPSAKTLPAVKSGDAGIASIARAEIRPGANNSSTSYMFTHMPQWPRAQIEKKPFSSSLIHNGNAGLLTEKK